MWAALAQQLEVLGTAEVYPGRDATDAVSSAFYPLVMWEAWAFSGPRDAWALGTICH